MYERLSNKKETPTMEEFISHIGKADKFFITIDNYLKDKFASEFKIYFDVHDKGWAISYHAKYLSKKTYLCNMVVEKDAFLFVTNLKEENLNRLYETATMYAKECIDNSPYRNKGWIEYRVVNAENLEEAKIIFQFKIDGIPSRYYKVQR